MPGQQSLIDMPIDAAPPHTRAAAEQGKAAPVSATAWYVLGVLCLINMVGYMDRMGLAILLQSIKVDLSLSDQQLGLLSGLAFALFYCTMGIPLARLADRSSRVRLLSACLALWSVMTAVSGFARTFPQLFLARVGVGIGEAGCIPPAHSIIGDYFPPDRRTFAVGIFQAGAAVGTSVGMIVIGLLGERLGWRAALQIVGLAGVPLALLAVMTMKEPARRDPPAAGRLATFPAIATLLRRPALVHLLIGISLAGMTAGALGQWIPTFLIRSFGLSMAQAGVSLGLVNVVAGVIGMVGGGFIAMRLMGRDLRWELWLPAIATLMAAPMYLFAMLSGSAWIVLAVKVPVNFLISSANAVGMGAVHSFAGSRERALAISLVLFMTTFVGMGVGPYVIGWLSDAFAPSMGKESLRYALLAISVTMPWAAVHFYLASRRSHIDRRS
jgi:predicted MFS family arabinose efflux permease